MVKKYNQQIIEYSKDKWGGDYDPTNITISNMVFRENGLVSEADLAMEKWMAAQDSLRNWSISAGSGSPRVQWVIAKYQQNEEEVKRIEATISALPGENRFRLLLETLNLIGSEDEKK